MCHSSDHDVLFSCLSPLSPLSSLCLSVSDSWWARLHSPHQLQYKSQSYSQLLTTLVPQLRTPKISYVLVSGNAAGLSLWILLSAHLPATLWILLPACLPANPPLWYSPLVISLLDFVLQLQLEESVTFCVSVFLGP